MRKNRKHWMLLVAAVFVLALTACSSKESGIQVLDSPGTEPEYLSFFSSISMSGSDVTKYWIDLFTETYNKQVYINFDGAAYYADEGLSYRELLVKRMKSSAPDDLYIINAEDVLEFEKEGYWLDLSGMDFVDNLSDAALYQSTYNGKVFSVPLSFTGFGFLWNVDLLEHYDLSIPQNLTEFLTVCETLKSNGVLPYGANKGFALTVPAMCVGFSKLYRGTDRDEKIAALNSGEILVSDYLHEGFAFLSMMMEKGYMDSQQALNATPRNEDLELFLAGECAFICAGLGDLSDIKERQFQMKLTGLPVLADGCISVYGASKRLCVNPSSRHLETALEFVEMVGSLEALEKSAQLDSVISSSKSVDVIQSKEEEELASLLKQAGQIPNQDFSLHFNTWESIRDIARELCGGVSVEQACVMLDERQKDDLIVYMQE